MVQLLNYHFGETSLFTDPFLTFSRQFIQAGLAFFLLALWIPTPLYIFTYLGDKDRLLESHAKPAVEAAICAFAAMSHLLLPTSTIFLFGLPSAIILASLTIKKILFVALFGSGHATSELVASLLILSGALPAIIILLPDRSLAFYIGTWILPALYVSKTVAEAKAVDQMCRVLSKKDVQRKGILLLISKAGANVLGLALGVGWIGRKAKLMRKPSVEGEAKK